MPFTRDKKAELKRILQSKEFRDSAVYANLLTYLVDASLSGNVPKETTIAIDVFGKDSDFNSNKDSSVRYHIYMLRKKLDSYYADEGQDSSLRLTIPKGRYEIEYKDPGHTYAEKVNGLLSFLNRWEVVIILTLIVLNLYFLIRQFNTDSGATASYTLNSVSQEDPVWGPFFSNDYPVLIVMGDDFLLDEFNPEYQRFRQIRDWEINSETDLYNFLNTHPRANLWKSEISGIPFGGVRNLMDLLPVIYQFQNDVELKMSSTLELNDIRNQNILYIGEFENLRILTKVLHQTPIRYQYNPDERVFVLGEENDTLRTFHRIEAPYQQKNKYNVDYSLLIKIPGVTGENYMFIVGFGYGGRLERTKMLGNRKLRSHLVESIEEIHGSVPQYFIALFEVKSIERTGFTNEIKYFKATPPEYYNADRTTLTSDDITGMRSDDYAPR